MKITINNIEIPIIDEFNVVINIDKEGEQFPENAVIYIKGGPLMIHGRENGPGLRIITEEPMQVYERYNNSGININSEPEKPGPRIKKYFPGDNIKDGSPRYVYIGQIYWILVKGTWYITSVNDDYKMQTTDSSVFSKKEIEKYIFLPNPGE